MLPRLGHYPLISGNHQHHQVHPSHPGHHGPDEFFMTRYVDDAEPDITRQFHVSESQFDGDTPFLLFLETIGVNSC